MHRLPLRGNGLCIALALSIGALSAQTTPSSAPPRAPSMFGAPLASPEVHADRRITFRLRAPEAKQVAVTRDGAPPLAMTRNEQGVWSVTTGPIEPDIYGYSFNADGLRIADPSNPSIKPSLMGAGSSLVHVPASPPASWDAQPVPRGVVHRHSYRSAIAGAARDYYVYTPPGYETGNQRYPILFLLHGITDDASAWTQVGRADVILDNLIAQGKAKPMIMVNTFGYGVADVSSFAAMASRQSMTNFARIVVEEVAPQVERAYRVAKGRESAAVAGLSMGGAQALQVGLNHLDRFAWVAAFSGAFVLYAPPGAPAQRPALDASAFEQAFPALDAKNAARLRMLWIACGTEDGLIGSNRQLKSWLKSKNVPYTELESPGAHTWMVWRRNLTELAPRLFQASTQSPSE